MHWMHQDAQKFRTVGFPRSDASLSVADPLKPSNVQSGSFLPTEVKLWGVQGGKGEAFVDFVHAAPARRETMTSSLSQRTERLCPKRRPPAGSGHPAHPIGTVGMR